MIKLILLQIGLFPNSRKEPYLLFHQILGFYPKSIEIYQLAVKHKSISTHNNSGLKLSNERLEFLGDAVLNSVVTDILYIRYKNQQEGFLTNMRSKIVKRESLNLLAINIGLDRLVKVSKYVNKHTNNNIYGNALEALMGAIYLDYGYKKCKQFVEEKLLRNIEDLDVLSEKEVNFKSKLIEWCQKHRVEPTFILANETIQSENKHVFETQLYINSKLICYSTGNNKKHSQQNASKEALAIIKANPSILKEIQNSEPFSDAAILHGPHTEEE